MTTLIVYQNSEHTFVVSLEDEAEFVARYFGEDGIDDDGWERFEVSGPVEIDSHRPEIYDVYETYDEL